MNPEKFRFCQREATFIGFLTGWDRYSPTEERLTAIRDFSMPSMPSLTDIRLFFSFMNQLTPLLATAPIMAPFGDLWARVVTGMSSLRLSSLRQRMWSAIWPRMA